MNRVLKSVGDSDLRRSMAKTKETGRISMNSVWVFNGEGGTFPSGVFSARETAETWIARHRLSGCLTNYPVDLPLYEWAITNGHFTPKFPSHQNAEFIQRFSSAYLEHYHYEVGVACGG
jgi:hypothetical protein